MSKPERLRSADFEANWHMMRQWVNMYLDSLSDSDLHRVLPSGNHGVWILGHLIASDDDLSLYLDAGPMLFPEYQEKFKQGAELPAITDCPPIPQLREQWQAVCDKNAAIYAALQDSELDRAHAMLRDPENDYFQTKAGCLRAWTLHQVHHAGQLAILASMAGKPKH